MKSLKAQNWVTKIDKNDHLFKKVEDITQGFDNISNLLKNNKDQSIQELEKEDEKSYYSQESKN